MLVETYLNAFWIIEEILPSVFETVMNKMNLQILAIYLLCVIQESKIYLYVIYEACLIEFLCFYH